METIRSRLQDAAGLGIFVITLCVILVLGSRAKVPDFGAWTGIRPLETKLEKLTEFSRAGKVDAIILGSSIVDFGFSAELFSHLMSEKLGRPYRAYNFSTGGAEVRTLPILYRFIRLAVKPKEIIVVVPPAARLSEETTPRYPDYTLTQAPVGQAINNLSLLKVSRAFWKLPFLRNATALRELMIFGHYKSLPTLMGQAYDLNDHGDRLSYLPAWSTEDLKKHRSNCENLLSLPEKNWAKKNLEKQLEYFFAKKDIDALKELRRMAEFDKVKILVLSHGAAAMLWERKKYPKKYNEAMQEFFFCLAKVLDGSFTDVLKDLGIPRYGISDTIHLNVYGAAIYTKAAFSRLLNEEAEHAFAPKKNSPEYKVPNLDFYPTNNPTFSPYAALLLREARKLHTGLQVEFVESLAVPPLPVNAEFSFALQRPDNTDLVIPARKTGKNSFRASLNLPEAANEEFYVFRLLAFVGGRQVALNAPISGFSWIGKQEKKK